MAVWTPGTPWPSGTPGGAAAPTWGGFVRVWIQAALASGRAFTMGADDQDRLDAGNVLAGGAAGPAARADTTPRLWVDLSCDVIDAEISGGASGSAGIFTKADAATATVTLTDPTGKYDPLNGHSPFAYGGHSRLVPGTPVQITAEVVDGAADPPTWTKYFLFVGTADSWGEDWTPNPSDRKAVLIATDITKQWVSYNRPEQSPVGAGDTVTQRIHRIVDFFGWPGTVVDPPGGSTVTLAATTLAQPGWEQLNRATDDELGYVYFDTEGRLRWFDRATWGVLTPPVITFGCPAISGGDPSMHDVLVDAAPSNLDRQIRNQVFASRSSGTMQTAASQSSIDRFGQFDYKRTDLGLADDAQSADWATYIVILYAYPQISISDVVALPGISDRSWEVWAAMLGITMVVDLVRIYWAPPDRPTEPVDAYSRVVGHTHRISRSAWEVTWTLIAASPIATSGSVFTMGPHANDRLDAGMVLGFTGLPGGS